MQGKGLHVPAKYPPGGYLRKRFLFTSYPSLCYPTCMEDTKTNKTLVNVVLDRSGSMSDTRAGTISGFNEYLNQLRKDSKIEYSVTLIQFDSPMNNAELTIKYVDKPLAEVPELTAADYEPRGCTPLYDAIGECVRRVETKDRSVLTVIITDGLENASREFTKESIKALIADKEKNEHWTFAFLGADIDSYAVGGSVGVSAANTSNYSKGNEDAMYQNLAFSTMTRSALAANRGTQCASRMDMFDDSQRAAMGGFPGSGVLPGTGGIGRTTGGCPPAAPPFRPSTRPVPVPSRKRTTWKTNV